MNAISLPTAPPPIEVDVEVKQAPSSEYDLLQTELSRHITDCWERAKFSKTEITDRLLRCERQRRGVYDPEKEMEIAKTGGSDIFMRMTDIKCRAAEAWIRDVMNAAGRRVFDLDTAEEPEVPPEVAAGIVELVRLEMQEFVQAGGMVHPEAFRARMEEVHDQIMDKMREQAKEAAARMADKIEDQLNVGRFPQAFQDFVSDFVTYPTAVMQGPVVRRRKKVTWGPNFQPVIINDFSRDFERVSPYDAFPSPNATNPQDGYFIRRHRLSRAALQELRGTPGYNDKAIDQVLERFGDAGFRSWLMGDQERDRLEGKMYARLFTREVIEAIEFWGSVSGKSLLDWGLKSTKERPIEWNREYEVTAWQVGPIVIKVAINPDPLGRRPYEIAQWNEIPGAFWGTALPEQMRDVQIMCNAAARALANNMGIASGPQAEIQVDRLPDGEDVTSMFPWKIWQTTSDRSGGGQPAVRFFHPEMNAQPLMMVHQYFNKQADEVTGIPAYLYSGTTGSGAGRTASGLSMLMDNAAKGIKTAIAALDMVVSAMVDRLYIHNMMYDPDPAIKGDFKVQARGAMGMVLKEQLQQRRAEFLQATANPVDMQILGINGRAYLLREIADSLQMDTSRLVPSPEMLQFNQEKQQAFQMAMAQMPGQGTPAAPQAPSNAPMADPGALPPL
jgi:hypothetical protein